MNKESDIGLLNVSPYDDSFPARLLSQAFDFSIEESDIVTNKIYSEVVKNSVNPAMYINPGEKKIRLVVDATDDFMEKNKDGTIKLVNKNGKLYAQLSSNRPSNLCKHWNCKEYSN